MQAIPLVRTADSISQGKVSGSVVNLASDVTDTLSLGGTAAGSNALKWAGRSILAGQVGLGTYEATQQGDTSRLKGAMVDLAVQSITGTKSTKTSTTGKLSTSGNEVAIGEGAAQGLAPNSTKPPIVGPVRPYDEATNARIPGYDNHHLDPKLGRVDPDYPTGPTIGVRNDNAGGRVPDGVNLHTAKGGFQTALNDHITKDLGFTIKQWNDLPDATRKLHLRRYYASLGIPFPF